jgi:cold shock CspA family protein
MARRTGRLAVWDDERGFGFVEADDGARLLGVRTETPCSSARAAP